MPGPGTILHDMIETWTGEEPNLSCSCMRWIRRMDKRPKWAYENVDLIVKKLMREATKRAEDWRAVPVDKKDNIVRAERGRAIWRGALKIPGSGMLLSVLVRQMVLAAIAKSKE